MSILGSYKAISNALLTFFLRPETVAASAPKTLEAIKSVETSSDGFVLLATILHQILPQFGGEHPDLLVEMSKLIPVPGEEYKNFHNRAVDLDTRLTLSRILVPPNLLVRHYLAQLNKCNEFKSLLAPYNRDMSKHLREKGDSVPFPESLGDINAFLKHSQCPDTLTLVEHGLLQHSTDFLPTANYASRPRVVCDVCDKGHNTDDCHLRGLAFMPPALAKKVERYNELHGHSPKNPKIDKLQKPYQARHAHVKPTANMVEHQMDNETKPTSKTENNIKIDNNNDDDLPTPPATDHSKSEVTPSCGMAQAPNVGDDYMEFLFPNVGMVAIELKDDNSTTQIPSSYVDHLTPTANMAHTQPLTSNTSTGGESDELFTHALLHNHKRVTTTFQADWGANVIIVNDKSLFTDFLACEAALYPVDGVPINKIKGYGTIILSIGQRLIPVREVAYMPENPQCTFTTSHLQRMNGFLPGIHAMHSSVKIVNWDGHSTKFSPVKKNGLDYIDIEVVVHTTAAPETTGSTAAVTPTANSAKTLSAELIHQKCGHFHHRRITELAKHRLIDGLPVNIPQLLHECPICLASKSIHHPRKPMKDYTLLRPGQ